ncbi:Clathrin assembly protein complex 2 beta large chain [Ancistrocladus abbreviatus]
MSSYFTLAEAARSPRIWETNNYFCAGTLFMYRSEQVPIGVVYRLSGVPKSNCINNGINKVYIPTRFNPASLNRHLARACNSSSGVTFRDGKVEVLAARDSRQEGKRWFQGTADDVRQFDWLFEVQRTKEIEDVLIVSGDTNGQHGFCPGKEHRTATIFRP